MRLIILLLCFFHSGFLIGRGIYVSATGNDLNKGNHWFVPFKTIQKAADLAVAGDTVYIMKGDYSTDAEALLSFNKSGNEKAWIVFKNYKNHQPQLQVKTKYGIHLRSCSYVSIEGLTIQTQKLYGSQTAVSDSTSVGIYLEGSYESPCTHIKLYNNFIRDHKGPALSANYFDYVTIGYNKFYKNASRAKGQAVVDLKNGVFIDDQAGWHSFIQANTFEKNSLFDSSQMTSCSPVILIQMAEKSELTHRSKVLIHNNLIYTNGSGSIWLESAIGVDIVNNSLYKNNENVICAKAEIQLIGSDYINILNNILYASTGQTGISNLVSKQLVIKNNLQYNTVQTEWGEHAIKSDPKFELINEENALYNFRLKGNSPAINSGKDSLVSDTDFEGNPRRVDFHVDLGALEFTNRILPSLKGFKTEIPSKGIKTYWSSIYTKDQKVYTVWNEEQREFYLKVYDFQGNVIFQAKSEHSVFELDLNVYKPGFYTVQAFNEKSSYSERIEMKKKP